MKAIEIDQELRALVAGEEVLAYFDFVVAVGEPRVAVEGLCKVARPRERRSKTTYLSTIFIVDAADAATQQALDAHMKAVDWSACAAASPGVDCVLAIPHQEAGKGLFVKEIDVYLDGTRPPDAAFVRDVLLPLFANAIRLAPSELTVWDEPAAAAPAADSLIGRLRRLAGGAS